jgi:hypothetical protein
MLGIAFSLFLGNKLPLSRKLALCVIFGLGLFTILCAILNKYYSFTHPFGSEWTYWYVRESSTALIVANMPFTWAILRKVFGVRSFNPTVDHPLPQHRSYRIPDASNFGSPKYTGPLYQGSDASNLCSAPSSPTQSSRSPETSLDHHRKRFSQPNWRRAGVYGRQDLEAMTLGDDTTAFDFGFQNHEHRTSGDSSTSGVHTALNVAPNQSVAEAPRLGVAIGDDTLHQNTVVMTEKDAIGETRSDVK